MRETLNKILFGSVVVLSAGTQLGYAIPVSPIDKAIGQECASSISAVKESRHKHQRCMQQIGGKEVVKAAQCHAEAEKLHVDEAALEKCKLITSHNVIKNMTEDRMGTESAG
jgi:hypothetical protein